jgi:hypothetical protein
MQECWLADSNSCKDLSLNESGCNNNQALGPMEEEGSHRMSTADIEVEVEDVMVGIEIRVRHGDKVEAVVIGMGIGDGGRVEAGLALALGHGLVAGVGAQGKVEAVAGLGLGAEPKVQHKYCCRALDPGFLDKPEKDRDNLPW